MGMFTPTEKLTIIVLLFTDQQSDLKKKIKNLFAYLSATLLETEKDSYLLNSSINPLYWAFCREEKRQK
jgi:hypothetical protein